MSDNSQVGIVIRTKDRPLLLRRALESALCQTYPHWQIRIVNDGGDKAVVEGLLEELGNRLKGRAKALHNPESTGMQNASNQGIADFDTEFLIIHDDDDSWEPTFLEETVAFLKDPPTPKYQGVICHSCRVVEWIDGNVVKNVAREESFNSWLEHVSLFRFLERNHFPPISFLFRRSAFDKVGAFEQEWNPLGDWEFNVRFLLEYEIGVIPKLLANYHHRVPQNQGAYGNTVTSAEGHRSYENALYNHWLREDIRKGQAGLGVVANISHSLSKVHLDHWYLKELREKAGSRKRDGKSLFPKLFKGEK